MSAQTTAHFTPTDDGFILDLSEEPLKVDIVDLNIARRVLPEVEPVDLATMLDAEDADLRWLIDRWRDEEVRITDPNRYSRPWITDEEMRVLIDTHLMVNLPMRLRILDMIVPSATDDDSAWFFEGPSLRQLRESVPGRNGDIDAMLKELIEEGVLEKRAGRNGGFSYWPAGHTMDPVTFEVTRQTPA